MLPDDAAEGERFSLLSVQDAHAALSRDRQNVLVRFALNVATDPQFTDTKIFENRRKPPKMILVGMREGDHVDFLDPARPQIR